MYLKDTRSGLADLTLCFLVSSIVVTASVVVGFGVLLVLKALIRLLLLLRSSSFPFRFPPAAAGVEAAHLETFAQSRFKAARLPCRS